MRRTLCAVSQYPPSISILILPAYISANRSLSAVNVRQRIGGNVRICIGRFIDEVLLLFRRAFKPIFFVHVTASVLCHCRNTKRPQ